MIRFCPVLRSGNVSSLGNATVAIRPISRRALAPGSIAQYSATGTSARLLMKLEGVCREKPTADPT